MSPNLTALLGPAKQSDDSPMTAGPDPMDGMMDAGAHDLIEAVHAKDHARAKDAFRAMFMACGGKSDDDGDEG